jgi:isopenicillin-N N-acyltransferase-like protein
VTRVLEIELSGEAHERGRQYGARVSVAIRRNVETYLRLLAFHAGLDREATLQAAGAFGPILETYTPDLLVEMQGIAEGAGCRLEDVLLLNARSELMGMLGKPAQRRDDTDGCTALAAAAEVTAQGQVLLGQNWDWYTAIEEEPILLRIRQLGKPEILTLVEAGQVAKIGLNSYGLGVCLNFLSHSHRSQGVPVHVLLRQVLGFAHLGDAIHCVYGVPRGGSANLLLGHAGGEILDLELTACDADYHYGDGGWLVHANHYESLRLRSGDTGLATSMSTLVRAARARRLLSAAAAQKDISRDTLRTILTDHTYGAYAICRHVQPAEAPLQQTATRASVIMDPQARTLSLAAGQPCREEYLTYTLEPME